MRSPETAPPSPFTVLSLRFHCATYCFSFRRAFSGENENAQAGGPERRSECLCISITEYTARAARHTALATG